MSKIKTLAAPLQQPTPPAQEGESENDHDSDVEFVLDGEAEKDETEQELERLVFGDSAGFRAGLGDIEEDVDAGADDGTGFEALDDADLFFTDTGDATLPGPTGETEDEDETVRSKHPAAWQDSDDERTLVSLASAPRLRKLRRTEAEDVVNGKDYTRRLRQQFELLNPRPAWAEQALQQPPNKRRRLSANTDSEDDDDDDMELDDDDVVSSVAPLSKLLQNASSLVRSVPAAAGKKRKVLRPEVLDIQRLPDIPGTQPSSITSLSFHPTLPLLLSSGPSSTLFLHQLASSPPALTANPLLTSLHVRGSALTTTQFHPTDSRIFLGARRRYFHVWDLKTGRVEKIARVYGQQHEQKSMERFKLSPDGAHMALLGSVKKGGGVINILSASTLQWVTQVRIESRGGIADFCWWRNGGGLCIAGKGGEVTEWDLRAQEVVGGGAVRVPWELLCSLSAANTEFVKSSIGTDRWVAVGSSSGIVNLYDRRAWLVDAGKGQEQVVPTMPKPVKTLSHLTTPTSNLVFSPDGQMLVMASKWKRDSLKVVHLPSATVFRNWPTDKTPLGRVSSVTVMGGGAGEDKDVLYTLAVGNEAGKLKLWEIR